MAMSAHVGPAVVLAAGCGGSPASPRPASGGGYLYWTYNDQIGRASLDGTGVDQRFITGASGAGMLAVSGGYLYWANIGYPRPGAADGGDTIGRRRLDGTGVNQQFITRAGFPTALAIDSRYIYWTSWGNARLAREHHQRFGRGGAIGRARLDGTGVNRKFISRGGDRGVAVNPRR
jgi:hypothetical protein